MSNSQEMTRTYSPKIHRTAPISVSPGTSTFWKKIHNRT